MKKALFTILVALFILSGCDNVLNPVPNDRITDDRVLTDAASAQSVVFGIYRGFANLTAPKIVAGDMTGDHLIQNGTFVQYIELGTKDISASNGSADALWSVIYSMAYETNFLLEGLPTLDNVPASFADEFSGTARFLRGYAYFIGAYTYGGIPIVETTNVDDNRVVPRATLDEVLEFVEQDYLFALANVPVEPRNSGEVSTGAVKAALARLYLYQGNWTEAERFASEVIDGVGVAAYSLEPTFSSIFNDFSSESILETVYSANDNPGTSTNFSVNNLFEGRREIIPSTFIISALQNNGGDRRDMIEFDGELVNAQDNGWTVTRYGPFDNIPVFRLAEVYLIRAEARAQLNRLNESLADINVIRNRARVTPIGNAGSTEQLLFAIEEERQVELAFEGHRWYDLVRTDRANEVMSPNYAKWTEDNELWPIPLREVTNNPSLQDAQNPGY